MDISEKKSFLKKLKQYGYDEVSTFLVYPNATNNNVFGKGAHFSVKMSKDYVNSDNFVNDINVDSGVVFVGLNYAQREDGYKGEAFQTMHDWSNGKSKDNSIAASLIDIHGANSSDKAIETARDSKSLDRSEAYGSFAFDIINKYSCTDLKGFVGKLVTKLKNEAPEVNVKDNFDMTKVKDEDATDSSDQEILDTLFDRLVKYDIPSFINLMNWVKPKGVICFGGDSEKLVNAINDIYHLNLNVQKVLHYSAQRSYADKRNSVHDAVENIIK